MRGDINGDVGGIIKGDDVTGIINGYVITGSVEGKVGGGLQPQKDNKR